MIIPGFSNYDITESGVVTHIPTGKVLKQHVANPGAYYSYVHVSIINDNGKRCSCNVLRLLAMTYLEKPEELCTARAKDGVNTHTELSNVMWVPYTEASKQAWLRGKMANRKPRQSSVNEDSIALLYDTMCLYDEPVSMVALSHELELPYSTIRYSMQALRECGKVRKLENGFEVIR